MRSLRLLLPFVLLSACIGPEDNPSSVHDLRVLGVQLEPPELMYTPSSGSCLDLPGSENFNPADLLAWAVPVQYRVLIADPAGEGRAIDYKLWLCADPNDRACEEQRILLSEGTTPPGEVVIPIQPGQEALEAGEAFFTELAANNDLGGLFGLWVPLVLELRAGDEEVRAQKLLVLSCKWYPQSEANQNPVLPGILLNGAPFADGQVLSGDGPFELVPEDFTALQVPYVLPTSTLEPVSLVETWKVAWHTDHGVFSPNQTGGTDVGGVSARHDTEWIPPQGGGPREVRFWFVVRDGRGGLSWITRTASYRP